MKLKLEKRLNTPWQLTILLPVASVVLAFSIVMVLLLFLGKDPFVAIRAMWQGAFGSRYSLSEAVVAATPLMLAGLGVGIAAKANLWNIGGDGQIVMGAFAASGLALFVPGIPKPLLIPAMAILAFIVGGLWALIASLPRAFLGINEIITTMMFNFIANFWIGYLVQGPWKDPKLMAFPLSAAFPSAAALPTFWGTRIHLGLVFALISAIFISLLLYGTRWGFELRVIGTSGSAAKYAGMNVTRNILLVMLLSGGLAGLAGMGEVTGIFHRLQEGIGAGDGFTAFIVIFLARGNPFAILLTSILMGGLMSGATSAQTVGISPEIGYMLQGLILFFILASEYFRKNKVKIEFKNRRAAHTIEQNGG
jgi:general nucleoside transport system permease protein